MEEKETKRRRRRKPVELESSKSIGYDMFNDYGACRREDSFEKCFMRTACMQRNQNDKVEKIKAICRPAYSISH